MGTTDDNTEYTRHRVKRDGKALEEVGFYNPLTDETHLKFNRIVERLKTGAQPTETVRNIFLKAKIFDIAGKDFNVNSTQQLANILFDELELPQIKKRSTAEEVLKKLRPHHELPALILEYRKYYK